ncbi:hypothetical protein [Devosia faecipullorum]|uniref:hypothetical protein n=1 Tax=Devosia faecipullorum TaxID=2755039 RepID=UPI00187B43CF|nr:hypothetical protein [Devosia faecipullorum]MBE7732526.1 hypothetical protein [Devosia faecipullorum]
MRVWLAFSLTLLLGGSGLAEECTLHNARYKQPDAPWYLTFQRVPQIAAANQIAAFYLEMPNSGVTLNGAVHVPNGFGAPIWSISGVCGPGTSEICAFPDEDRHSPIYGLYDGKVRFLDSEPGSNAPEQLIVPDLAASIWYSQYRNDEWFDAVSPGDAFMLDGCK